MPKPTHPAAGSAPARRGATRLAVGAACMLLSGAGTLVVETVWLRWLRLLLGATAPAASATLVAFFAGQAAGAALAARFAPRLRRPLRAYAGVELLAAALAAATPFVLAAAEGLLAERYDALRDSPARLTLARFAVAWSATFPAALAFGASLPLLASAVVVRSSALGSRGNVLYAVQTFGAAAGAALAAFWLPAALGVRGTYALGLGALVAAAAVAALFSPRHPSRQRSETTRTMRRRRRRPLPGRRARVALATLSGFVSFAAQVLLVQTFALVVDQSVQAFGAVLVSVLAALGIGAAFCAIAIGRSPNHADRLVRVGLAGAGLGLAAFPALFVWATGGLAVLRAPPDTSYPFAVLTLAATTAGPMLLAAALVLPGTLALEGRGDARTHGGARLGWLLAANTSGAIAGALAAPYGLLPVLGLWGGFAALGVLCLAVVALLPAAHTTRAATLLPVAAGAAAIFAFANPVAQPPLRLDPGEELVELTTTPSGLVAVVRRPRDLVIETDNHYTLGGASEQIHQQRQAHLPLVLHGAPHDVAYVGSATGISAGAALEHPIESLRVVELVPEVARAARRHFGAWNGGVYSDPRTEVVLDDGRNYLRSTSDRFDVVVADLFVPWRSGTGALYTREHFQDVRERLNPGGLFCQWLPLYQLAEPELLAILTSFADAFPEAALFRGDFYGRFPIVALIGWRDRPAPLEVIDAAATSLAEAGVGDRWVTNPLGVWSLYVAPLTGLGRALNGIPRNLDDRPLVEFGAPRLRQAGNVRSVVGLAWSERSEQLAGRVRGDDPLFGPLGADRLEAAAGGRWLQRADALWASRQPELAAAALAEASARLPAALFSAAPADPTVATLWHDATLPPR